MKNRIIVLIMIFSMLLFNGCNNTQNTSNDDNSNKTSINVDNAILMEENDDGSYKLFELSNGKMNFLDKVEKLMDFKYDISSQVKLKLIFLDKGDNLMKNKLIVDTSDGEKSIDNLYSIADFKLSPNGKYIAYRGFKEDNVESIDDLNFYNIEKEEVTLINSNILISGDMYDFKNENTLIYYGVDPKNNVQGIYEYDIDDNSEEMVYEVKDEYLTYMAYIKEGMCLAIQDDLIETKLSLINLNDKTSKDISSDIEKIIDSYIIEDKIYFIGKFKNEDLGVYKYKDGVLKRLTYGFPKVVYEKSYLSSDKDGNLYFVGYGENEEIRDVYSVKEDDSVNLISKDSAKYLIYKNASYSK